MNIFCSITLKDGSTHDVTSDDLNKYKSLFKDLNIEAELSMIAQWNLINVKKRKTKRGIESHIFNWLKKSMNTRMYSPQRKGNCNETHIRSASKKQQYWDRLKSESDKLND